MFLALVQVIYMILSLYMWVLIISALLSWLLVFNVANPNNEVVAKVGDLCRRLTEPALRPLRKYVPTVNGVDLSYLALFFLLMFVRLMIRNSFPIYW